MRDLKFRLVLSLPAIACMIWYIWLFITSVIPMLHRHISEIGKFTISQIVLLILGFVVGPIIFIIALTWLIVVWLED